MNKGANEINMKRRLQRLCSCALLCALLLAALPLPLGQGPVPALG